MFYCTFTTGENKTKPTHVMCDANGCVYIPHLYIRMVSTRSKAFRKIYFE